MITVKGSVFSIEPELIEVAAIIDGEETTTRVSGTGVQVITKTGNTVKLSARVATDKVRGMVSVGDNVIITLAKE
jgi:hypothetical protein